MIKTVIFDLDGTLMDTIEDLFAAMNGMLKIMKYPPISREQVRAYIGNGAREFVRLAVSPATEDEEKVSGSLAIYREIYDRDSTSRSHPFAGIVPMLDSLKTKGKTLAVLSNKPDHATKAVVNAFFGDRFDLVVGQREGVPVKPDPTAVKLMLAELGANPSETLFVGDGETDYLTAVAAGVPVASVLWGYRSREELAKFGATVFAETPAQLEALIDRAGSSLRSDS